MMKRILILFIFFGLLFPSFPVFAEDGSADGEIKPAPWSGEWWSRKKGFLIKSWPGHDPSPFERYDKYVESVTGTNPGALEWEANFRNRHYNPKAEDWEGHCNGWSASSILEPEPKEKKVRNGIVFETSDQKAILAELYMNTYCMFYGKRYWGNAGDDQDDIYPDQFHKLLMEYVATKKSPMVCDITSDKQVWNFPLFKFRSQWSSGWFSDNKLKVETTCYFADDGVKPEYLGTKWFAITYTYNLFVDDDENIIGGEWTKGSKKNHPDFVWVPSADAPNPPGTVEENPRLDPKFVHDIIQGPAEVNAPRQPAVSPDTVLMQAGLDPSSLF